MSDAPQRVAYLGPPGTNTDEALRASASGPFEPVSCTTVPEAIMAVQDGAAERAVVPIENSLEGGVAATLDALAGDASDVRIVGETVQPIHHHLIAAAPLDLGAIRRVLSHPHALGQCSRFLRDRLPHAEVAAASSTAEAVRSLSDADRPWAAIGSGLSAELYDATIVAERIEDRRDNVTRFVWLAPAADAQTPAGGPAKTSIVFWGFNDAAPGALVSVLRELSDREINLTKIESRPRRVRLGHYMFFADLEASAAEPRVEEALTALAGRVETLRVLGSYPVAPVLGEPGSS
ncbi:MAG TPA: prephenate dehydratase [Thermoleophilaceae bacterium]|nr:prephenate dehydratase [Thermoleophilaceae bacterium]